VNRMLCHSVYIGLPFVSKKLEI